jgi:hypothetical protein
MAQSYTPGAQILTVTRLKELPIDQLYTILKDLQASIYSSNCETQNWERLIAYQDTVKDIIQKKRKLA